MKYYNPGPGDKLVRDIRDQLALDLEAVTKIDDAVWSAFRERNYNELRAKLFPLIEQVGAIKSWLEAKLVEAEYYAAKEDTLDTEGKNS